mmetsp:Transcript_16586/g.41552  ORF Transcript_16586/g.41552 Transcript_16586/m.41552 type:complete len:485 (-) Transcript_16586:114-1568(-)
MKTCELRFVLCLVLLIGAITCTSCFFYGGHLHILGTGIHRNQSWRQQRQGLFVHPDESRSDLYHHGKKGVHNAVATEKLPLDRRSFLRAPPLALGVWGSVLQQLPTVAKAATLEKEGDGRLADAIVQSLVFEKVLGSGSYKTVYLVSATLPETNTGSTKIFRYAMAVEQLRNKRDVKNAFRGVEIPGRIQQGLKDSEKELLETIVDWWVQSSNVPDFEQGKAIFEAATRSRKEPKKNFAGSRWMVSLKPEYDMDFKRFIRNSPALFPVGQVGSETTEWTESILLAFVLEILHAGKLLHEAGIVHRDIKPKNMMIFSSGSSAKRPVIIDYGFSEFGSSLLLEEKKTDICVERPGQLKGEVDYVLPEDLANYRGCQRGDAYAMGKTMYEFVFGSVELQDQNNNDEVISVEGADIRNQKFRNLLYTDPAAGSMSRFRLSRDAADSLLLIVRGLCGNPKDARNALSFAEAEEILSDFLAQKAVTTALK